MFKTLIDYYTQEKINISLEELEIPTPWIFTENGKPRIIDIRSCGDFRWKGFRLSPRYEWYIGYDRNGDLVLLAKNPKEYVLNAK